MEGDTPDSASVSFYAEGTLHGATRVLSTPRDEPPYEAPHRAASENRPTKSKMRTPPPGFVAPQMQTEWLL